MQDYLIHSDQSYPVPENESERQAKLESYNILDTFPEDEFDSLVELAAIITDSPVSLMNLLDQGRQWTKAAYGRNYQEEVPRSDSVCQYTILNEENLEITDLKEDDRFKTKDFVVNTPGYRSYSGYPLITPDGFKIGAICVLDYTPKSLTPSQKKALKTISEEIISRLELRKKQYELEKLNQEKDQFLRVVNHDIKSPINGIVSATHYLQNMWEGDEDELQQFLSMIKISGEKLIDYTRELMENSMAKHHTELHLELVDLIPSVSDLIDIYTPLAKAKNVTLGYCYNVAKRFTLDEEKFKLILSNLISNALKFTKSGDSIYIDIEIIKGTPRLLHVSVADTGIGIPKEYIPTLFKKVKKHQRQGTRGEISTGMGLPLVKQFVELHHGSVKVDTQEGKGTTFHVVIEELTK